MECNDASAGVRYLSGCHCQTSVDEVMARPLAAALSVATFSQAITCQTDVAGQPPALLAVYVSFSKSDVAVTAVVVRLPISGS